MKSCSDWQVTWCAESWFAYCKLMLFLMNFVYQTFQEEETCFARQCCAERLVNTIYILKLWFFDSSSVGGWPSAGGKMIWIIDQSVLLMSLQTYPLEVQRLSQTLWWSGHPKAINKTMMLRHLLVLHPNKNYGYPKMIWKGYVKTILSWPFWVQYPCKINTKTCWVGTTAKTPTATPQNHPTPRRILETPTLAHLVSTTHADTTGAPQEMSTNKASRISFPETYSDCGIIFQELQMSPHRGHFNKKRIVSQSRTDMILGLPLGQGSMMYFTEMKGNMFSSTQDGR